MTPVPNIKLNENSRVQFLKKTYAMVDDPSTNSTVSWSETHNSLVVWDTHEFARVILRKYFGHDNLSSFVKQLNTYGFHRVYCGRWEYAHEAFLRGRKDLFNTIRRRNPKQKPQARNSAVGAYVEGLEEEIERLKSDKEDLVQQLDVLRQQQQSTDHQLQTLGKRMEQMQQQMMSFFVKPMQQHNGQINKNQPLLMNNDAVKAMLMQTSILGALLEDEPTEFPY